ncbi:MAG: hypothetical protein RL329_1396 [Bacteroidota bacterium]
MDVRISRILRIFTDFSRFFHDFFKSKSVKICEIREIRTSINPHQNGQRATVLKKNASTKFLTIAGYQLPDSKIISCPSVDFNFKTIIGMDGHMQITEL